MLRTVALLQSKKNESVSRSLALSVHFRNPAFGMKDYEILSRATAFLLSVDPPEPSSSEGEYSYLEESRKKREDRLRKLNYAAEPAGGPPRHVKDLGWLEFCPTKFRPRVHCVASSHVLAPWLWKNYYPQEWLQEVKQEHCMYSLEVFNPASPQEALAKFALNPFAIHHPNKMDLAIIHLKQEDSVLHHITGLGVEILRLRDDEDLFEKGEEIVFDGFVVTEDSSADAQTMEETAKKEESEDDTRIFVPHEETGTLAFATAERFLATTETPLPEGLCGGPALDQNGRVCGVIEGIVPKDHKDERIAGAASFLPSPLVAAFLDYAEHLMLQEIMPKDLFDKIVELKTGKPLVPQSTQYHLGEEESNDAGGEELMENAFRDTIESLKKSHSMEEYSAILGTIEREREEVLEILNREGGDLDEIIAKVRQKTRKVQKEILENLRSSSDMQEGDYKEKDGSPKA